MKQKILFLFVSILSLTSHGQDTAKTITISNDLQVTPLSPSVYLHVSYLTSPSFGRVACNGLIYINSDEAVFMDTPPNESITNDLINWFSKTFPGVRIKGIIVNHFHEDCLGGLAAFHKAGARSYSHRLTPLLIKEDSVTRPQVTFNKRLSITVGNQKVICYYPGEAHTKDNIVTWIPGEKVLFGGCMVKTMNAGKGNLADANIKEWPDTITRLKQTFKTAKTVIPGHGNYGGMELLDYTIQLFSGTVQNDAGK